MPPPQEKAEIAVVAVPLSVDRLFDYKIPPSLQDTIQPGMRLRVPFRQQMLTGYCVKLKARSPFPHLKEVSEILDPAPLVGPHLLELTRWLSRHCLCSWGEALQAALPAGVRKGTTSRSIPFVRTLLSPEAIGRQLPALDRKAPKQAKLLRVLLEDPPPVPLVKLLGLVGCGRAVLDGPLRKRWIEIMHLPAEDDPLLEPAQAKTDPFHPSDPQRDALARIGEMIDRKTFAPFLLEGVTGSGKTEVYLQSIARVVEKGGQAIVLLPEISLTPQTVGRFRERFPRVAVLHSHLTDGQRYAQWQQIFRGEAQVVIGARSAIFAPTPRLGLIVLDEEHENSFKQESKPRYHARTAALERGRIEQAVVLLGSATPSLESVHAARQGETALLRLPERIGGRPLPPVEVVDMIEEQKDHKHPVLLSRRLIRAVRESIEAGQQVLLFLNRRGYATSLSCRRCGHILQCRNCNVSLILHREAGRLRCHYCLWSIALPQACPDCGMPGLHPFGAGTERIETEVRRAFPAARVARMDSDTTRGRLSHQRILDPFKAGEIDILIGTQMIAKGLDFPRVTCVGVVSADTALYLPDFRSAERTFQLITQVAGRTGRGPEGGVVIVQTRYPDHYSIAGAARHDARAFAERELSYREKFRYPPFSRLVRFLLQARTEGPAQGVLLSLKKEAEKRSAGDANAPLEILGPAPAPLARLEGRYRWHLLMKFALDADPAAFARKLPITGDRQSRIDVDIDPQSLL
jgi:primosomal protein N' (replication factor Y)